MAATFASPKETDVPIVFDSDTTNNPTGFATQGIGLRGADHASLGGSRIGGAPGTDFKFDTDRNPAA